MRTKFTVECEMEEEQADTFLALLEYMEYCGKIGHSANLVVHIDGDGGFRPEFKSDRKTSTTVTGNRTLRVKNVFPGEEWDFIVNGTIFLD